MHETLNLLHLVECKMLHFVTSYMKQNKSRKQTLKSAQNGLEIIFNQPLCSTVTKNQIVPTNTIHVHVLMN